MTDISDNVLSCERMITGAAYQVYRSVPERDRRWIAPEDLLQEAFLAAIETEKVWSGALGNKFSTHLHRRLAWWASNRKAGLYTGKRVTKLVELDAPTGSEDGGSQVESIGDGKDVASDYQMKLDCDALLAAVKPEHGDAMRAYLASGTPIEPKVRAAIRRVASGIGLTLSDVLPSKHRKAKVKSELRSPVKRAKVSSAQPPWECCVCRKNFTDQDAADRRFVRATLVCMACYKAMHRDQGLCFGKPAYYSASHPDCSLHCADRVVCSVFVRRILTAAAQKPGSAEPERTPVTAVPSPAEPEREAAELCPAVVSESVPAEPERPLAAPGPAAAPEPAEPLRKRKRKTPVHVPKIDDGEISPPEGIPMWPFRRMSTMRYVFQRMFAGVKESDLLRDTARFVVNPKAIINVMNDCSYPVWKPDTRHPTHTWEVVKETDGTLRIVNFRYHAPPPGETV